MSAALLALSAGPLSAAIRTVTSSLDDGSAGTLRKAIADAAPGDEIQFSLTYPATINLENTLHIEKNLTITGPGSANLFISGGGSLQVFDINLVAIASISGVTIQNGYVSRFDLGAGIRNGSGATLTLTNSTVSGNSADSDGGGIYSRGTLTLINSIVSGIRPSEAAASTTPAAAH